MAVRLTAFKDHLGLNKQPQQQQQQLANTNSQGVYDSYCAHCSKPSISAPSSTNSKQTAPGGVDRQLQGICSLTLQPIGIPCPSAAATSPSDPTAVFCRCPNSSQAKSPKSPKMVIPKLQIQPASDPNSLASTAGIETPTEELNGQQLFQDSDEEAIVEECWKEIRRASRKSKTDRRLKHLKNSLEHHHKRKARPSVKPIIEEHLLCKSATLDMQNNKHSAVTAVKSLQPTHNGRLAGSMPTAHSDSDLKQQDRSSPGPPSGQLEFRIPSDIIYADQSLTYSSVDCKDNRMVLPSVRQAQQIIRLAGSFGETDDDDLDSVFSSSDSSPTDLDEAEELLEEEEEAAHVKQPCWREDDQQLHIYEIIADCSLGNYPLSRRRCASTEVSVLTGKSQSKSMPALDTPQSILKGSAQPKKDQKQRLQANVSMMSPVEEANKLADVRCLTIPFLPEARDNLSQDEVKRRHVVQTLIESENSYVETLKRLFYEYQLPLQEADPLIISQGKIKIIFSSLSSILQCHAMLRVGLLGAMAKWNEQEKIGDALCGFLSSSVLLDVYSQFVNNFSQAMEMAKRCTLHKYAFSQFLKEKQNCYSDRLSFFGLMIKPIQRFPQYIMVMQDLIKHTAHDHLDHVPLMRAFTLLENLTEVLNYRKMISEQQFAAQAIHHGSNKKFRFPVPPRFLCRIQTMELVMTEKGLVSRLKPRILILLDSHLICARNLERTFEMTSCINPSANHHQPSTSLQIKWIFPLSQIQLVTEKNLGSHSSVTPVSSDANETSTNLPVLFTELSNLIHDFAVVRNIGFLVAALKGQYEVLTGELTTEIAEYIKDRMKRINEAISLMDKSRIQLILPSRLKDGPLVKLMYQLPDIATKLEWIEQFLSARLRFDQCLKPSWDCPSEENSLICLESPSFLKRFILYKTDNSTEILCSAVTTVPDNDKAFQMWMCVRELATIDLVMVTVKMEIYDVMPKLTKRKELPPGTTPVSIVAFGDCIIVLLAEPKQLLVWNTSTTEQQEEVDLLDPPSFGHVVDGRLLVGFRTGKISLFAFSSEGTLDREKTVSVSTVPIECFCLVNNEKLYVGSGNTLFIFTWPNLDHESTYQLGPVDKTIRNLTCSCGALWIVFKDSPILKLYEAKTLKHLQDLDVSVSVKKSLSGSLNPNRRFPERTLHAGQDHAIGSISEISVTTIVATPSGMWIGTNVGITVVYPLPKLAGFPVLNGPGMVSFYGHQSPVGYLGSTCQLSKPKQPSTDDDSVSMRTDVESTVEDSGLATTPNAVTPTASPQSKPKHSPLTKLESAPVCGSESASTANQINVPNSLTLTNRWGSLMNLPVICETELEDLSPGDDDPSNVQPQVSATSVLAQACEPSMAAPLALAGEHAPASPSPIEKAQHMLNDSFSTMFEGSKRGVRGGKIKLFGGGGGKSSSANNFADKLVKFSARKGSKESTTSSLCSTSTMMPSGMSIASKNSTIIHRDSGYSSFTNFDSYHFQMMSTGLRRSKKTSNIRQLVISAGSGFYYWPATDKHANEANSPCVIIWELSR